jgi:hypothetical protein
MVVMVVMVVVVVMVVMWACPSNASVSSQMSG